MSKHYHKATDLQLTLDYLQRRAQYSIDAGYTKQKWIEFSETLIKRGFHLTLYEAKQTYSKYITITHPKCHNTSYKVRFSNHKPIYWREINGDCDFFVGVNHTETTTTDDALKAVYKFFKQKYYTFN